VTPSLQRGALLSNLDGVHRNCSLKALSSFDLVHTERRPPVAPCALDNVHMSAHEFPTEKRGFALHIEAPLSRSPSLREPPYFSSSPLHSQRGALYYRLPWTLPEGVTTRSQTSKGQTHHWPAMQKSRLLLSKQSLAPLPLHNQLCISPSISPGFSCFAISLSKEAPSFRSL
jgi:hypothetical protein